MPIQLGYHARPSACEPGPVLLRVAAFLSSGPIRSRRTGLRGYGHDLGGRLGRRLAGLRVQGLSDPVRLWKPLVGYVFCWDMGYTITITINRVYGPLRFRYGVNSSMANGVWVVGGVVRNERISRRMEHDTILPLHERDTPVSQTAGGQVFSTDNDGRAFTIRNGLDGLDDGGRQARTPSSSSR